MNASDYIGKTVRLKGGTETAKVIKISADGYEEVMTDQQLNGYFWQYIERLEIVDAPKPSKPQLTMPCGCTIKVTIHSKDGSFIPSRNDGIDVQLDRCPMHEHAQELLDFLNAYSICGVDKLVVDAAKALVAKCTPAKGSQDAKSS